MASTSSNSPHLLVMKAMGVSSNCGRQDVRTPDGAGRIGRQPRTAAAPSCQFSRILGSRAAILRDEKRPGVPHRIIMQMHRHSFIGGAIALGVSSGTSVRSILHADWN